MRTSLRRTTSAREAEVALAPFRSTSHEPGPGLRVLRNMWWRPLPSKSQVQPHRVSSLDARISLIAPQSFGLLISVDIGAAGITRQREALRFAIDRAAINSSSKRRERRSQFRFAQAIPLRAFPSC